MALNILKLSILLFFVVKPFLFAEPRTLEASEHHPFTKTLQNLKGIHKGQKVKGVGKLKSYLKKIGYLTNDNSSNDHFDENIELALKDYQTFHHLRATGYVDVETIKKLGLPRCGVPDIITHHKPNKLVILANYSFFSGSPKWEDSKRALTYTYISSVNVLSMNLVRHAMESAFQSWSRVTNFTFTEIRSKGNLANIIIGFHSRNHGDGYPFDGPGEVLAHAFAPQVGRLHFDAEEPWTTNPMGQNVGLGGNRGWRWRRRVPPRRTRGIDLETVALHEIGHLIGLGHSRVPGSVMFPNYEGVRRDLTQDDVDGIQALYGSSN